MAKPETSCSMSLTVAARRVYDFKVEDYSFVKRMASFGEHFQSDTFSVGGYDWAVRFSSSYPSDVSFYLVSLSKFAAGRVGVSFACTLLEKSGKPSATVKKRVCSEFFYYGQREGISRFMSEKDFVKHLRGDSFTVRCTISVLRKPKT